MGKLPGTLEAPSWLKRRVEALRLSLDLETGERNWSLQPQAEELVELLQNKDAILAEQTAKTTGGRTDSFIGLLRLDPLLISSEYGAFRLAELVLQARWGRAKRPKSIRDSRRSRGNREEHRAARAQQTLSDIFKVVVAEGKSKSEVDYDSVFLRFVDEIWVADVVLSAISDSRKKGGIHVGRTSLEAQFNIYVDDEYISYLRRRGVKGRTRAARTRLAHSLGSHEANYADSHQKTDDWLDRTFTEAKWQINELAVKKGRVVDAILKQLNAPVDSSHLSRNYCADIARKYYVTKCVVEHLRANGKSGKSMAVRTLTARAMGYGGAEKMEVGKKAEEFFSSEGVFV